MKVRDLIKLLERCPQNDLIMAADSRIDSNTASVNDVIVGGRVHEGFTFIQLSADAWVNKIDELKFQRNAAENEASKNRGETAHWIDVPPLRHIDHPTRECSGCGRRFGRAVSYDMRYCSWCGRKIRSIANEEQK